MSSPLDIPQNTEIRHQRIETLSIPARHATDEAAIFIFPNRGSLSGDSRLILPCTCIDDCYQYSPVAGVLSLIKQVTFRVGDVVVCQLDEGGKLYVMKSFLQHLEKRELVDSVINGISSSFETCSGSRRSGKSAEAEVFGGQMRLVADKYTLLEPSTKVKGDVAARPWLVNGEPFTNYQLKTFHANKRDAAGILTEAGTPDFSINLSQLLPGLFGKHLAFPLHLVDKSDEIAIELTFSNNGGFATNERAILCPEKQTNNLTGIVAITRVAGGDAYGVSQRDVTASTTGGTGKNCRVKFDTDSNGQAINIRVLDSGSGYAATDTLTVAGAPAGGTAMTLQPAHKISSFTNADNFIITTAGTGYTTAGTAELLNETHSECSIPVTITVAGGAVTGVTIDASYENLSRFVCSPNVIYAIKSDLQEATASDARVKLTTEVVVVTSAGGANNFVVGDDIEMTNATANKGIVMAIDGNNKPTKIDGYAGTWDEETITANTAVNKVGAAATTCNLTWVSNTATTESNGLGSGGLYSYDVVQPAEVGKINIVTSKVRIATDLIFNDVQDELDRAAMMSDAGIQRIYTQFRNVETSLAGSNPSAYGSSEKDENTKLIGYSNEVLRALLISNYPSGTQDRDECENKGLPKRNPLLLDYCSRDSLKADGVELQLTINSVPRYSSPISTNPYLYTELSECYGAFYIPRGAYCGYLDCKQLDNADTTATSRQPGFSINRDIATATSQYEPNEHRANFSNQSYMGVNQKYMRGNLSYMGINLQKVNGQNALGNGVKIGNQAIQIDHNYESTNNSYYAGASRLSIFGEVERFFVLRKGKVSVSSASTV